MIYDNILFYRFRSGSPEALGKLYDRLRLPMLKVAVLLTGDPAAAEDIVQDVFMNLVKNKNAAARIRDIKSYLFRAVSNRAKNVYRAKSPQSLAHAADLPGGRPAPDSWLIQNEQLGRLAAHMNALSFDQRQVILLHIEAGLKFRRIAEIQNVSVNTVTSRYRYGITKLKSLLNGELSHE